LAGTLSYVSDQVVHAEVRKDGAALIPAAEVAEVGGRPGDQLELRLVRGRKGPRTRKVPSSYGSLKLPKPVPWSAFETASRAAARDAESDAWKS